MDKTFKSKHKSVHKIYALLMRISFTNHLFLKLYTLA